MKKLALVLTAFVLPAGGLASAAPPGENRSPGRGFVAEILKKYKAEDPKAHAELMKLRTTDRGAFRTEVGKLIRAAVRKNPELRKKFPSGRPRPTFKVPDTVRVVRDIVYAKYGSRQVMLDLYLPKKAPSGKMPCIMVIHGGGWRSGNKARFARFASAFAQKGFAAACIGYRLIPEVRVRQCVEDAKASVRWVRANAGKHNIDAGRIGAFGGSAGAHLAAILGTSFKAKSLEGKGGNDGQSSRVHAVVSMATPSDLTAFGRVGNGDKDVAKLISPAAYVDADSAKFLLMHSKGDRVVPYKQSIILRDKLKAASVPVTLITLDGGGHAFWNGTGPAAIKALADAIKFFQETLKNEKVD